MDHLVRQWRADGYRPGVAVRRLVEQYGLPMEEATHLVQRIYETSEPIRAYRDNRRLRLIVNLVLITAGLAIALPSLFQLFSLDHPANYWAERFQRQALMVLGTASFLVGFTRLFQRPSV